MGAEITEELTASREFKLSGAVEAPGHPGLGKKLGGISVTSSLEDIISNADAVVDFTAPAAALAHTEACVNAGKPIVIGTTGFSSSQREHIEKASDNIPLLLSPNMSSGINLMLRLAAEAARCLSDFDIEITEIHHNRKKDAPSGTAAVIAEKLKKIRGGSRLVYGREGEAGPRSKKEIGIHSLRGGDVTGEHSVIFSGAGERFEITHRAHSRRAFVSGTLSAVKYIVSKPPGLYSMEDMLRG